jgi:hypothetical protein
MVFIALLVFLILTRAGIIGEMFFRHPLPYHSKTANVNISRTSLPASLVAGKGAKARA